MEIAKDFNDMTRSGGRKDMSEEAYKIWARSILKKVIKPDFYSMVASNFSEMETSYSNRHNFGIIIDGIFEILSEDNEGVNIGCRIDDLIRNNLPDLFRNGKLYLTIISWRVFFVKNYDQ